MNGAVPSAVRDGLSRLAGCGYTGVVMPVALLLFIAAAAPAPPRIGIFDLKCADPTLADSAMDVLAAAVAELRQGEVVTRSDLAAMVGAQKLQDALGCDDVGCLTDIGNAAGVERLVTGSVDLTDPGLVVSLKVLSLRQARVENRVTVRSSAGRRQLPDVLGVAAELLLVPEAARAPGVLSLRGGPAGLTATVLGKTHETSPVELPPGVYDVELRARGHAPALRSAAVRAGKVTILDATLSPRQDHRTWGALLGIEAATPRGVGFHSNRAGFGVDAGFWMDLRWLAILPRLAVRYGPPGGDDALYVDGALDLGVYWLPLDRGITPLVGFGLGGRYLYTRDPTRTDTFGSVLTVTHEVVPTDSRLGLAGYGRVGALFFRDTSAPFVVALDWSIASFGEHDRPQAFQLSLGVVL